jgi:hypothetical protein
LTITWNTGRSGGPRLMPAVPLLALAKLWEERRAGEGSGV